LLVNRQQAHKRTTGNYIMRINELLVESQQLDEGPFTQAIGKVGGKIAKGVANIGKDLKTGFKAGYSGEQPPADAAATTAPAAAAAPTQAAPVQKAAPAATSGVKQGLTKAFAAPTAATTAPAAADPAATTPPAADTTAAPAATTAPAADPAAEKAAKIGVGQINKIIPTLRTRDLMSLQANLEKTIASKKKAAPAAPAAEPAAAAPAAPAITPPAADPAAATTTAPAADAKVKKPRAKKAVAPTQAEIDADRERNIGITSDSVNRTEPSLSETLARKVQEQKQRMFETALMTGTQSVFKK
jgi:hypothetical protein